METNVRKNYGQNGDEMKWICNACIDIEKPCILEVELPEMDLVQPEHCPFQEKYAKWEIVK